MRVVCSCDVLKVEEANEHYKVCVTNVEERRDDLENTKRDILTRLRTLVFQCDLTLKAVSCFFIEGNREKVLGSDEF